MNDRRLYPDAHPQWTPPLMYYFQLNYPETTKERVERDRLNRIYLRDRIKVGTVLYRWGKAFTVEKVDCHKIFIDGDWLKWKEVQMYVDYGSLKFDADNLPF